MRRYGLFGFLKPYLFTYFIFFFLWSLSSLLNLVPPFLVKIIIDEVILKSDFSLMLNLILVFGGSIFLASVLGVISNYLYYFITKNFEFDMEKTIFSSILSSKMSSVRKENLGDVINVMDGDVEGASNLVFNIIGDLTSTIVTILVILGVSFTLSWKLTLVALLPMPLLILGQVYYGKKIKSAFKDIRKIGSEILDFLQQRLRDIQLIQIFNNKQYENRLFEDKYGSYVKKNISFEFLRSLRTTFVDVVSLTSKSIVLVFGGYLVLKGETTIGIFVAMYTYTDMLLDPVRSLASIYSSIKKNQVSADRVSSLLYRLEEMPEGDIEPEKSRPFVELRDVSFSYDRKPVLSQVSLKFENGRLYGITGPSGCGKSTIALLISRIYDPSKGKITYNGKDIRSLRLSQLRDSVTIVTSEAVLYDETIADNIRYGNIDAPDAKVHQAASAAGIHEYVMSLPMNYATPIGSIEQNLSEGQKQRICIARALLRDSPILFIDEAMSVLDARNQERLLSLLHSMKKDRIIILISHQLNMLEDLDEIIFLNEGKVEETGQFRQLLKKKKMFYEFYLLQKGSHNNKRLLPKSKKRLKHQES